MKIFAALLISLLIFQACKTKPDTMGDEFVMDESGEFVFDDVAYDSTLEDYDWEGEDWDETYPYDEYTNSYNPSRTLFVDLVHTKLEVNFNWMQSRMNGKATITMKPHFYDTDSVVLDAKGMDILKVEMMGKPLSYQYDSTKLSIRLGQIFKRNQNFTINIDYVAKPEERSTSGSAAITSDKGLYFINPKGEDSEVMPQIWTQGETEANSVWFPTIDAPNVKTSEEILMTVDAKYVTLSNGKLISSKKNADGTRTDHWKQELAHAPYLFMMAVGEFKIVSDSYTKADGKKVEVNYYVEEEHVKSAKAIFGKTPKMIGYFSKLLGVEYAWDKYSQIVVRDYVSGAMENTGAVIFGDYVYKDEKALLDGDDESTIAHELFHHWFGDLVTCESWSNLPLNESFANYAQYLWDEFEYGQDQADLNADIEADGYYNSSSGNGYHPLIYFNFADKEDMFDGHSYNKGGRILHMLRSHLGDEAFFAGLNKYLTDQMFKSAEVHDLRRAFETVSGQDLNWFFNQWFLGSGHPVIFTNQLDNPDAKQVILTVNQAQDVDKFSLFRLPVNIALWDDQGQHIYPVVLDSLTQTFTFNYIGSLRNLLIDNDQMLLAKVYEEKPINQFVDQFYNSTRIKAKITALKRIAYSKPTQLASVLRDALNSKSWGIRQEALSILSANEKIVTAEIKMAIKKIMSNDDKSSNRVAAVKLVNTLEKEEAVAALLKILEADPSNAVKTEALAQLMIIDNTAGVLLAKSYKTSPDLEKRVQASEILGEYGDSDDYQFLENMVLIENPKGYDQLRVMLGYTYFVMRKEIEYQEKSVAVYAFLKENKNTYTDWYFNLAVGRMVEIANESASAIQESINDAADKNQSAEVNKLKGDLKRTLDLVDKLNPLIEVEEEEK